MKMLLSLCSVLLLLGTTDAHANSSPPVKKSKNGICHPIGGTYYSQTKNFTPYNSMADCIASGGRAPKR